VIWREIGVLGVIFLGVFGGKVGFWAKNGVFARSKSQMLKWVRQN
jgi:hypothetical protein